MTRRHPLCLAISEERMLVSSSGVRETKASISPTPSLASSWVEQEVETAFEKERESGGKLVLFPVRLDNSVMDAKSGWAAHIKRTRHIGDFRQWKDHDAYQEAFKRLMRDLEAE